MATKPLTHPSIHPFTRICDTQALGKLEKEVRELQEMNDNGRSSIDRLKHCIEVSGGEAAPVSPALFPLSRLCHPTSSPLTVPQNARTHNDKHPHTQSSKKEEQLTKAEHEAAATALTEELEGLLHEIRAQTENLCKTLGIDPTDARLVRTTG
jgi:hypothetical protein